MLKQTLTSLLKKRKLLSQKKVPGFTLIELAIVMIIVGIITAGVFKGKDLIEEARLHTTLTELNRVKMLLIQYKEQFGEWPGNDPLAETYFQNVKKGSGHGLIRGEESSQVWVHLKHANLCESTEAPSCKIGGYFSVQGSPKGYPGNWIVLSARPGTLEPVLTPKQALFIKSKWGEIAPDEGQLRVMNGDGSSHCLNGNTYNTSYTSPACIIMMKL